MKILRVKGGYFTKSPLTNFAKMRITTIQIGILHVLINILSVSLLPRIHDTSGYFEMQKA